MPEKHVFVQVVRSAQDPFGGLKAALATEGGTTQIGVTFTEKQFDHIKSVEYSDRKFMRMFLYPKIFRQLERQLSAAVASADGKTTVYFSDEGVWAVLWTHLRRKWGQDRFVGVNVQHGFAIARAAKFPTVRRVVNGISTLLTGYPSVGYGSLAGAGPEPFDLYLTYDATTAAFIEKHSGCCAIPAPHLIKYDLLRSASNAAGARRTEGFVRALFAMNINVRGSPVKCDAIETYDHIYDLAVAMREMNGLLAIRLHPGMNRNEEIARFHGHRISQVAELDEHSELSQSLTESQIVMSLLSTVIWEGSLLGLIPVQVQCDCCDDVDLQFPCEKLNIAEDFKSVLGDMVARARSAGIDGWEDRAAVEWATVRQLLTEMGS